MRWICAAVTIALLAPPALLAATATTATTAPTAPASDDAARAVVERGIRAQGGPLKLPRTGVMRTTLRGTLVLAPGQPAAAVTIERIRQRPDVDATAIRVDTGETGETGGRPVVQVQGIVGGRAFMKLDGIARAVSDQDAAEMLAYQQSADLDRLDFLADDDCRVTSLAEAKVQGRDAAGVLVERPGRPPVKLYFDKETTLLVQREHPMLDSATGKTIMQAAVFGDYSVEADGVRRYTKVTVFRGGEKVLDAQVIDRSNRTDPDPHHDMGDFPPPAQDHA